MVVMPRLTSALLFALILGGCDLVDRYMGAPIKPPLPGERQTVLRGAGTRLAADPRAPAATMVLPPPVQSLAWPQPGGAPGQAMQHMAVSGIGVAWRAALGQGTTRDGRVTGSPVVADGRVFALDAGTQLSAFDAASGATLWRIDIAPPGTRSTAGGGGVALSGSTLFAAIGQAQIVALEAASGRELWRTSLTAPFRSGPVVAGNRVYAISVDNQVHGLDGQTGRKLWSHAGITETAGLFGSSSPVIDGNTLIASFSSGEIFALRAETGRVLWTEGLSGGTLRSDAISSLSDIRGLPVVDRGVVFAVSHGGQMAAIDLRSGARIWEQPIGSLATPWLAGDHLFVTTLDSELVALNRRDGRIRWVTQLETFTDPDRRRGRIVWSGPSLAGNRLILFNSRGQLLTIAPETGAVLERLALPGSVTAAPALAGGTLYVVTDSAELLALR